MKQIKENPDFFNLPNGKRLKYYNATAYAFGYYKNKLYISNIPGENHETIGDENELKMNKHARDAMTYPGRFWIDSKAISFWKYPKDNKEMQTICNDISTTFNERKDVKKIDIWNDYIIDIIENKESGDLYDKYISDDGEIPDGYKIRLIPVKSYKSSLGRSNKELQIPHIMTPMDKHRQGIKIHAPGFGAERRFTLPSKYVSKIGKGYNIKDIPPFVKHQLQYTSDGTIKLKSLVESPDTFIISNRKKLRPYDDDAYSFGYFEGGLYISDNAETHSDLMYDDSLDDLDINRYDLEYPGRLWIKSKTISFWKYPKSNEEMRKIANDISDRFNNLNDKRINVWDNFRIDVIVDNKTGEIYTEYMSDFGTIPDTCHMEIIPVKDYRKNISNNMIPKQKRFDLPLSKLDVVGKGYKLNDIPAFVKHGIEKTSDSIIKLKSLVETTIAKVSKDINVKIDIDKTYHAGQRQFRHEIPISNIEITEIVKLALPEIANRLMFDEINMGSYVLVKHTGTDINIVGALHHGVNDTIDFVVVTVMRKKDFIPKRNTTVIEV